MASQEQNTQAASTEQSVDKGTRTEDVPAVQDTTEAQSAEHSDGDEVSQNDEQDPLQNPYEDVESSDSDNPCVAPRLWKNPGDTDLSEEDSDYANSSDEGAESTPLQRRSTTRGRKAQKQEPTPYIVEEGGYFTLHSGEAEYVNRWRLMRRPFPSARVRRMHTPPPPEFRNRNLPHLPLAIDLPRRATM